ncbi:MAG: DUF3857 domain-containing protein [Muribaculaceae bacterium]
MKHIILIIFSAIISFCASAAKETISIPPIPPEMRINANSVIISDNTTIECSSLTSGVAKYSTTVQILNTKGTEHGNFTCFCDPFTSLKKFNGRILDAKGNIIREIRKSDLKMTAYSSALADDSYMYYYECYVPTYPYTIIYEWEEKYDDAIIGFPSLSPLSYYNQSVMKSSYSITVPKAMDCRYKECNIAKAVERSEEASNVSIKASINNIMPFEHKPYMGNIAELIPKIYFAPKNFSFKGHNGNMDTWNNFGKWLYSLQNGRDILPDDFKIKLHAITDSCTNNREKLKVVYDLLAKTTRYVSIQLGIGGLQPMAAEKVCSLGFGDCKGLTNYMKAMLSEIGINSNYTVISMTNEKLKHDFASASQMDHVILQVPLPNDTIWLECTSPDLPLGYIHSKIAGHDALIISDKGGILCQLPAYPDSINKHIIKYDVLLTPTCGATIKMYEKEYLRKFEASEDFISKSTNQQIEILRNSINLINNNITDINVTKDKSPIPILNTSYKISTEQFGKRTGNRMFVPVNIFRSKYDKYDCKERTVDFILSGELLCDTISIAIPQGYVIESMPKSLKINSKLGSFCSSYKSIDNTIFITQTLHLRKGKYPATLNNAFATMYNTVIKCYNDKIILLKKE